MHSRSMTQATPAPPAPPGGVGGGVPDWSNEKETAGDEGLITTETLAEGIDGNDLRRRG